MSHRAVEGAGAWVNISWNPQTGQLSFVSNLNRVELTAILEMCKQANVREMMGGAGRPNESGGNITGTVRGASLQVRRADSTA